MTTDGRDLANHIVARVGDVDGLDGQLEGRLALVERDATRPLEGRRERWVAISKTTSPFEGRSRYSRYRLDLPRVIIAIGLEHE